jgi:hypothetical protein
MSDTELKEKGLMAGKALLTSQITSHFGEDLTTIIVLKLSVGCFLPL